MRLTWIRNRRHSVDVELPEAVDDDEAVSGGREVHVANRHRRSSHFRRRLLKQVA
jgi:hypothetical protein